jgi:AraC-like DNA-binding protein
MLTLSSLSRIFHQTTGLSLRRYVGRLRDLTAAHHLASGSRDLTTIALDLGYNGHSHFTCPDGASAWPAIA